METHKIAAENPSGPNLGISPSSKSNPSSKRHILILELIILLVLVSAITIVFLESPLSPLSSPPPESESSALPEKPSPPSFKISPSPSPLPTSTPKPLPSGPQLYNFSHGKNVVGPKPTQATIDPIDPKKGGSQTLTVNIKHTVPVTKASLTLKTDNDNKTLKLTLIDGTTTAGTWQATWVMEDTYNYIYQIAFNFSDGTNTFTGGLAFR